MNENEIIALERIAVVSRNFLNSVDDDADKGELARNIVNLRREVMALDVIRVEAKQTALDIIQQECDLYPEDSSLDILAVNIHKALLEAGYL